MTDRREQILDRLETVLKTVRGAGIVLRNKAEISDSQLPAIILFDADEFADDQDPKPRPVTSPRRVSMVPEIRIMLGGAPDTVGTDLNLLRVRSLAAILGDATLIALTAEGQGIRYDGCATQLKVGRSMQGDMLMSVRFTYYLKPNDL